MSVRNFVYSKDLEGSCGQYSVANCRCDVSAFDLRKSMWRNSKIDVATFEDRCIAFRRSTIDVTMCRPSKIDVSTFGDRCVDLRRSMIDVSTFDLMSVSTPCQYAYVYIILTPHEYYTELPALAINAASNKPGLFFFLFFFL